MQVKKTPIAELTKEPAKSAEESNLVMANREDNITYMDDTNYHAMSEFLGIDYQARNNDQVAEKVAFLADWAKDRTKSDDRLQHQMAIKDLIRSLGLQMRGEELIYKLYKWTRLDMDRKRIEQKMEVMI